MLCKLVTMSIDVTLSDDPRWVLQQSRSFLAANPAANNVMLTLLQERIDRPELGRYWIASKSGQTVGVVLQSPTRFPALLSTMEADAIEAIVDSIAKADIGLPGALGEAGSAARFAGRWAEVHRSGAVPVQGQRVYEMIRPEPAKGTPGSLRKASSSDRATVTAYVRGFQAETSDFRGDPEQFAAQLVQQEKAWLWEDAGPAAMVASTTPTEGVVRMRFTYVPHQRRNRGYGSTCLGTVSKRMCESGFRCIIYTDLSNGLANSMYRRLGYRAVLESVRYRFDGG
jgi:uncharacterized protein